MKEIELVAKDKIEVVKQVAIKKKRGFIGSVRLGDGHICYEYNLNNYELRKAKLLKSNFVLGSKNSTNKRVDVKEDCFYVTALNTKNAVKKLLKFFPKSPCIIEVLNEG